MLQIRNVLKFYMAYHLSIRYMRTLNEQGHSLDGTSGNTTNIRLDQQASAALEASPRAPSSLYPCCNTELLYCTEKITS